MIAYVYFKESKIISCKINNIESISEIDKEIKGNDNSIRYGDSQDYICLTSDSLNLNVGDTIVLDNLTDERNYFLNKEQWYQDKLKQHKEIINGLQDNLNISQTNFNSLADTLVELSLNITV